MWAPSATSRRCCVSPPQNGFLLRALAGLARTAVSPYRKLRSTLGIAQYTEDEFTQKLDARRLQPPNGCRAQHGTQPGPRMSGS